MDEGLPIAYGLLEKDVPVLDRDGEQVGTVHHVVCAQEKDIFHGLVINTPGHGQRFVEAADVGSLHEHGVDLRIDSAAVAGLDPPGGGAPVYTENPDMTKWAHWAHRATLRKDWHKQN